MGILSSSGLVNWESESDPAAKDFLFLPFFALFFPSVRLFLDTYVFEVSFTGNFVNWLYY